MKFYIPALFLCVLLTACSPKTQPAEAPAPSPEAAPAVEAQAKEEAAQDTQTKEEAAKDDPSEPEAAKVEPSEPAKAESPRIEFPQIDATLQTDSSVKDNHGNLIEVYYAANADEPGKSEKIEAQLREAGFTKVSNGYINNYEKVLGDQVVMIRIEEGEGDLMIGMFRTRDPQNRYSKADPRIPYPLEQGFAAEFAKQKAGDEGDIIYTYYNRSAEFLPDYEKRLVEAGFKVVRNDDRPLYTKKLSDGIVLTVLVIKLDDRGSDMKIVMGAVAQDVDLTDNNYE